MSKSSKLFIPLILTTLIIGCGPVPSVPSLRNTEVPQPTSTKSVSVSVERSLLTFNNLINGFDHSSPINEMALTLPFDAPRPEHTFEGHLELIGEKDTGEMLILRGDQEQQPEVKHLPEFDFVFVQNDGYLIPVQRGLIITNHPYWDYILEPGRVWQEKSDQGYSRASFPFALVWKGSNAIMNGTMTFLFNDESISKVWYQVTQETTNTLNADMWGLLDGKYHPESVQDADSIKTAFGQELEYRFPTKPISELENDYPGVNISAFGQGVSRSGMTWYGFVINGVNYLGGCETRFGIYPYCESMRIPSYSTAKSAFIGVALMRLAEKYDAGVPDLLIKDFVPEAANSPGDWSSVTFNDILDMATGNYRSAEHMVDEEKWDPAFWGSDYYKDIIKAAFNWPNSNSPGTQWVYRTTDTFILSSAMQNYLESKEGPDSDIFEFVVDEVYKPLKMAPGVFSVIRTKDNNGYGLPYGGYGIWWIPDDLAKIGNFLNVDNGKIDGIQILNPDVLSAALQRDPSDRGVDRIGQGKYNNSFWADRYSSGFDCEFWVPQMLGYSGIVVALFPNGTTYYYASDQREFTWNGALVESNNLSPICR